jgi:hypothetical protein
MSAPEPGRVLRRRSRTRAPFAAAAAAALCAAVALSACKPAPAPETIDVVGDSITVQSHWNRDDQWRAAGSGLDAGYDLAVDAWLGYTFADVQQRLTDRVHDPDAPRPSILVVALGANNASTDFGAPGWTADDGAAFSKLINTPHPDTCVVVVLPAAGRSATQAFRDNVARGRSTMRAIAAKRPRTVLVDWAPVIAAHPGYLRSDGIHLADDQPAPGTFANADAADAYGALLWAGVARCPPPVPVSK